MAALSNLLLICAVLDATAVSITANEKAHPSVVRREVGDHRVHLDAAGHASLTQEKPKAKEPTACDLQYLQMDEGTDECTGDHHPEAVNDPEGCMESALQFAGAGISKMEDTEECKTALAAGSSCNYWEQFEQTTHLLGVLPVPKGCYLNTTTKKVHFNPTASNLTGVTITGKKICVRTKYVNGTENTNPQDGCTAGTSPILNYDKCLAASLCVDGGGACKLQEFKDNVTTYKKPDRPMGCFVDSQRCWGFNHALLAEITGTVNGTPVCLEAGATATDLATATASDAATTAAATL